MKVAFVTELPFFGKISKDHDNMRTEFAWLFALSADNVPILNLQGIPDNYYDVAIIIIPKKLQHYTHIPIVSNLKRIAKKTAFMQEGPSWYYQDLPLDLSFLTIDIMNSVDFVLAHNECDRIYYSGLLGKPTFVNPTLMIEETIKDLPEVVREQTMIGGNFCRWYGGFDSYTVALELGGVISIPCMGRMLPEEKNIEGIQHIPYTNWTDWMKRLNNYKFGVHLMPTVAAGTFSLNCAYLGIPCIGNEKIDTQRFCFPDLSVDVMDIRTAIMRARLLIESKDFYDEVSKKAKQSYDNNFSLRVYQKWMDDVLKKVCSL